MQGRSSGINYSDACPRCCNWATFRHSNPALPPHALVLQIAPCDGLRGLGEHCLDFYPFNRVRRQLGLNHTADQKVLLLGHGLHSRPFAEQQFLGGQGIHGALFRFEVGLPRHCFGQHNHRHGVVAAPIEKGFFGIKNYCVSNMPQRAKHRP